MLIEWKGVSGTDNLKLNSKNRRCWVDAQWTHGRQLQDQRTWRPLLAPSGTVGIQAG